VTLPLARSIDRAVRDALQPYDRAVLAVSGGIDSMVLLHAATSVCDRERLVVATFDHGTGQAATTATAFVAETCRALNVGCVVARADRSLESEAELREARWRFLRGVAAERDARIVSAHTESDQIETVLMRVLRGAGARGLAGLYAASAIVRPLLAFTRSDIAEYAATHDLGWTEDPSNQSPRFFRNRVRRDLLPAFRRVRPTFERELLATARAAAVWRDQVEAFVERVSVAVYSDGLDVQVSLFANRSADEAAILWPALASHAGVTLDRRATARLAAFTVRSRVGARVSLAGRWTVTRARDEFQLRGPEQTPLREAVLAGDRGLVWGDWSFRPTDEPRGSDEMSACVPSNCAVTVRAWRPGDAMAVRASGPKRKVKHLLSRAGITGHDRSGWPVVLADNEIVWIPGVRRADAAAARSDQSGLAFVCERHHRRSATTRPQGAANRLHEGRHRRASG
jgi:tRNA(Ile)-lysidine synthase